MMVSRVKGTELYISHTAGAPSQKKSIPSVVPQTPLIHSRSCVQREFAWARQRGVCLAVIPPNDARNTTATVRFRGMHQLGEQTAICHSPRMTEIFDLMMTEIIDTPLWGRQALYKRYSLGADPGSSYQKPSYWSLFLSTER